jgi:hypothetical protein
MYLIIGLILLIFIIIKFRLLINFKSFFKRGFRPKRGKWGIYCYHGSQGKGKTFSLTEYVVTHKDKSIYYSNYHLNGIEYNFYTGFDGLMRIKDDLDNGRIIVPKGKQLVIIYDEIFTELMKGSRLSKPVLDFLCQMRKRHIIFLTTAQYWSEIPISFRRFCRYAIKCSTIPLLFNGILIKKFEDAENMKWDEREMDFVAPLIKTQISKYRLDVSRAYDTFERVTSSPCEAKK